MDSSVMRLSYKPQSELRWILRDWLSLSGLHLVVSTIDARVLPRGFGLYSPNVAHTFILVTKAIYILYK